MSTRTSDLVGFCTHVCDPAFVYVGELNERFLQKKKKTFSRFLMALCFFGRKIARHPQSKPCCDHIKVWISVNPFTLLAFELWMKLSRIFHLP